MFCHRKFYMYWTSFKRLRVLLDHFFLSQYVTSKFRFDYIKIWWTGILHSIMVCAFSCAISCYNVIIILQEYFKMVQNEVLLDWFTLCDGAQFLLKFLSILQFKSGDNLWWKSWFIDILSQLINKSINSTNHCYSV